MLCDKNTFLSQPLRLVKMKNRNIFILLTYIDSVCVCICVYVNEILEEYKNLIFKNVCESLKYNFNNAVS